MVQQDREVLEVGQQAEIKHETLQRMISLHWVGKVSRRVKTRPKTKIQAKRIIRTRRGSTVFIRIIHSNSTGRILWAGWVAAYHLVRQVRSILVQFRQEMYILGFNRDKGMWISSNSKG